MKKMALAALTMVAVGGASAQVYTGLTYGSTTFNVDCAGTTTCDKSDTGYKLYGGYKITPHIAVEGGYMKFGQARFSVPVTTYYYSYYYGYYSTAYNTPAELKSEALYVAGSFRLPFTSNFGGVGRIGVAAVKSELQVSGAVNADATQAKGLLGLGLEYAFTPHFRVTADADVTQTAEVHTAYGSVTSGSLVLLSLGAQYQF
jgi:OOP family OmpA-OmpF porin